MSQQIILRTYTKFLAFCTLFLIFAGGMVTGTGSGLAVPDWPLSYGSLFPPMVGGVFYEHGHRMVATLVGFLTLVLAFWLHFTETRAWVKVLGWCALGLVIAQGVLGGLTVMYFLPMPISVSHATIAQTFFILALFIAYTQTKERKAREGEAIKFHKGFRQALIAFIVLVYLQLIFGAIMRHTHSGLAIPDFPTMGGFWLPPFNAQMLFNINDWRFDHDLDPVTMGQIVIHFIHRVGALLIVVAMAALHMAGLKRYKELKTIRLNFVLMDILLTTQVLLGMITVLSGRNEVLTSLHVINGAAFLGSAVLLLFRTTDLSIKKWQ